MIMTEQYKREVAWRIFSDALKTATVVPRSDEQFAVQFTKLATGHLVNRIFACGTLIEKTDYGTETPFWSLKISDTQGSFSATIGQYSPQLAQNMIEDLEVPCFVAVTGKIKANEKDDRTYFGVAVEAINEITVETYDRWVAETTIQSAEREASHV